MSRKYYLPVIALLIVAITHFFPGCDELVTEVTQETIIQWVRADFSADKESGCTPLTVQFNENSGGEPDSFFWRFGDGDTSSERDPEHTYQIGGEFACTLTVFDTVNGNQDTEIKKRFIIVGTTRGDFVADPDTVCVGQEVTFAPSEVGMITQWQWDFGDGSAVITDSNPNPVTHVYDSIATYSVKLTVTDSCGTKTDTNVVLVWNCATVLFFADTTEGCAPLTVTFFDTSLVDTTQTAIESRSWDFGNGQTSSQQNPSVTYDTGGVYTVTLTVTDSKGAKSTDSLVDYIAVYKSTSAEFSTASPTGACFSQYQQFLVKFINESPGDIDVFTWDFGDSTTSNDTNPVHAFVVPGFYTVKLKVEGPCGIDSVISENLIILSDTLTFAAFSIVPDTIGDINTVFTFADTSGGVIFDREWTIDDTITFADSLQILQQFPDTGWHSISLTVGNDCGSVSVVKSVYVDTVVAK